MSSNHSSLSVSRRALWTACGAAALTLLSATVLADVDAGVKPQFIVRYTDLDLAKSKDAAVLYTRLERAARTVCRGFEGQELSRKRMRRKCELETLNDAVAAVDNPALDALHASDARVRLAQQRAAGTPRT